MMIHLLLILLLLTISAAFQLDSTRLSRREFGFIASTTVSTTVASPASANESTISTSATKTRSPIVSKTLCDPSVSTWTKRDRTVHILGTAHISSSSAELAGKMVREIQPNVVFVELDKKRVSRAGIGGATSGLSTQSSSSN